MSSKQIRTASLVTFISKEQEPEQGFLKTSRSWVHMSDCDCCVTVKAQLSQLYITKAWQTYIVVLVCLYYQKAHRSTCQNMCLKPGNLSNLTRHFPAWRGWILLASYQLEVIYDPCLHAHFLR